MLRLLLIILILIASVWVGLHIAADPGYVLLAYKHWRIEMPLWLALIAILTSVILLYFLIRLLAAALHLPQRLQTWITNRRFKLALRATSRGLIALAEGQWERAEKFLIKGVNGSSNSVINYLAAAKAAQRLQASDRRDKYLRLAQRLDHRAELAVSLTQAKLQLEQQHLEQALASLQQCYRLAPRNQTVLLLLQQVYMELQDWEQWLALLPSLKKYKVLSVEQLYSLAEVAYQAVINQEAKHNDYQRLQQVWSLVPKSLKLSTTVVAAYVKGLTQLNKVEIAEKTLRQALDNNWDPYLLNCYCELDPSLGLQQLKTAEKWLKIHANDPGLLAGLGRLCVNQKLWGPAKTYFARSLEIKKNQSVLFALAQLHETLYEQEQALRYYREYAEAEEAKSFRTYTKRAKLC